MDFANINFAAVLSTAAIATVVIGAFMGRQGRAMTSGGGAGIVSFELARFPEAAQAILDRWGESGREAARRSLLIDYVWVVAYAAFLAGWLLWAGSEARATPWAGDDWIWWLAVIAAAAVAAAGVLDWVENTLLLSVLSKGPTKELTASAHNAAMLKFGLVIVGAAVAAFATSALWLLGGFSTQTS